MKALCVLILFGTVLGFSTMYGQNQPFIFTLHGGLFFPSNVNFKSTYQSSSDLIWGGGVCLPMRPYLFTIFDMAYFKTETMIPSTNDSSMSLSEQFLHFGILNKRQIAGDLFLRFSAGVSYTSVKQTTASLTSPSKSTSADKRLGYFGGVGIEQQLDAQGHFSLFTDVLYDYRRSKQKDLYGDFGGLRAILGIHMILF
jgi:hypothetical protein